MEGDPLDRATLGSCPRCKSTIPDTGMVLIYERHENRVVYAHCPHCGSVVHMR
ncbi:MAG: hypothetical protein ABEJ58_07165 [Halodesulfurarchaeum sp.]